MKFLWTDLRAIAGSIDKPWTLLGDFNVVKSLTEIDGGACSWDYGMHDFKELA